VVATTKITTKITRRKPAAYNIKYLLFMEREREREKKKERERERERASTSRAAWSTNRKKKMSTNATVFTAIYICTSLRILSDYYYVGSIMSNSCIF